MQFTLEQMQHFVAVAEEKSFTRAAERLFIAQPALSRKIQSLESDLGRSLLQRSTRHVQLTRAGEVFYKHAKQILSSCDALEQSLSQLDAPVCAPLRLGYGSNAQFSYAMRLTAAFHHVFPSVPLQTICGDVLEPLYTGEIDAAMLMACETRGQDWLDWLPLDSAGLSVFFSPDDPLVKEEGPVSLRQIRDRRFILPQRRNISTLVPCTSLHDAIRTWLLANGVQKKQLDVARGAQAFSIAICSSVSVGLMPDSSRVIANNLLYCRPIAECREGFEIVLAWPRAKAETAPLCDLIRIAKR